MKVLRERGSSIKNNDWDEYRRLNLVLDSVKRDLYRDCVTPVSAFVTFEQEEGMERCLTLGDAQSRVRVLGEQVRVSKAAEPTDIVWENREVTKLSRFARFILIASAVSAIMVVCFATIVGLQQQTFHIKNKYQRVDCSDVEAVYSSEMITDYAVDEWYAYYQP